MMITRAARFFLQAYPIVLGLVLCHHVGGVESKMLIPGKLLRLRGMSGKIAPARASTGTVNMEALYNIQPGASAAAAGALKSIHCSGGGGTQTDTPTEPPDDPPWGGMGGSCTGENGGATMRSVPRRNWPGV